MKTTLKKIAMLALMFGTLLSHAKDLNLESVSKEKITTVLTYKGVKKGHLITIKNSNDAVIHKETVERNGNYVKKFDFSSLQDGNYTIELDKDFEILIRPFKIKNNEVIYDYAHEKSVFKPVFRLANNKVLISALSLQSHPLNIELRYNNEVIYSEKAEGTQVIERVYSLSSQLKGNYQVVLNFEDRTYVKSFKI